jgi:hypothetical protein
MSPSQIGGKEGRKEGREGGKEEEGFQCDFE